MKMTNIYRWIYSLLFFLMVAPVFSQQGNALLMKSGTRYLKPNVEEWSLNFKVQNEQVFNNHFYKILQFSAIPSTTETAKLQQGGITLLSYLPVNAYIASFGPGFTPGVLSETDVISVTDLLATDRMAPTLLEETLPVHALRDSLRIELIITLFADVETAAARAHLALYHPEIVNEKGQGRYLTIMVPLDELPTLAALPYVQFIEPVDPPSEPENHRGRNLHRATTAFSNAHGTHDFDGRGVTVMLNDDGYIGPHIDFTNRIPHQFTTTTGADHGDHCAGTILGAGNLNPLAMGMAPAAELVVYGASNYPGFDSIFNQYNTLGIRITSTSYSNGCNAGYTSLAAMMDDQVNSMPELMHVFSAGNNGSQNCGYGAGNGWGNITGGHKIGKNVIAVANVNDKDELAASSSRGPAHDGRLKPDVSALGTGVFSTSENQTYTTKSGTSMACPGVAGSMALLYDAYIRQHSGNPNAGLMKSVLMNTADDLGNPGPDFKFGYGRINIRRALEVLDDTLWHSDTITQSDSTTYTLTVPIGTTELRIMLYWTDYEGTVNTTKALVNDLDMVVTMADSVWLPWVLNHNPTVSSLQSIATRKSDTLNNAEQITLLNPIPGNYSIKVKGTSVPMGPQPFYINWHLTQNDIHLTHPQTGSALIPGTTEIIRWDAFHDTLPFQLEYAEVGPLIWNTINLVIAEDMRHYEWIVPPVASGTVWMRLTRGSNTSLIGPFTILDVPQNISIDWVCMDSLKLSWNSDTNAIGYEIFHLGNKYMDSLTFTTAPSVVIGGLDPLTSDWFSVKAYGPYGAVGQRSEAVLRSPGLFNCVYTYDLALDEIIVPQSEILSVCQNNNPIFPSIRIKNNGSATISGFDIAYRNNQGNVITETVSATLAPGDTINHTFGTPFIPGTIPGVHVIQIWVDLSNDLYPYNDTSSVPVLLQHFPTHQLPYTETFETFNLCITSNSCEDETCNLSAGWHNAGNSLYDDTDWLPVRGATPSFFTGPTADHTLGTSSGVFLYTEASACPERTAAIISPCIDLNGSTLPFLSFWYHMYGSNMGSLHLDVLSDGEWHSDIVPPIAGNQGQLWNNAEIDLSTFAGKIINLRFRAITGSGYLSDIALDDISIVETVGMGLHLADMKLTISPNPTNSDVSISGSGLTDPSLQVYIRNAHGQLVRESVMLNDGNGRFAGRISVSGLSSGVYLVQLVHRQGFETRRLVVIQP